MGNKISDTNKRRAWGDKEHGHTDTGYIHALFQKQQWAVLLGLLEANPDAPIITTPDKVAQGMLPIHKCILKGASMELIEKLVQVYPQGLDVADESGMRPLHYACIYNFCLDKQYMKLRNELVQDSYGFVLRLLLATSPDSAKAADNDGRIPLHLAASSKACKLAVQDLLQYHGDGSARRTKAGKLPLHYALENRLSTEAIQVIIDAYPAGMGESAMLKNALHCACEGRAAFETIQRLIDAYPQGLSEKSIESMLPLHLACANKQPLETIALLLARLPESVYDRDKNSRMPLHHALETNAPDDVILHLLETAPDSARATGYFPHLPLHVAVEKNHSSLVLLCLLRHHIAAAAEKDMFGVLPLRRIIKMKGEEDSIVTVLDAYPEAASDLDEYDRLSLHYACGRRMSISVISKLIDACPSSTAVPDKNGQLPLHLSVMRSADNDILELLLEGFPQAVMVPDNFNYLPLHHAIELDASIDVFKLLIKTDKTCAGVRMDGKPPLHYAVEMRRPRAVLELLLEAFPSVAQEKEAELGRLPLSWAIERMMPLDTLLLIESYFPAERAAFVSDDTGRLPLHYAVEYDAPVELVRILLKANPTVVTVKELPFYYYNAKDFEFIDVDTKSIIAKGKSVSAVAEEERVAAEAKAEVARLASIRKKNMDSRLSNAPYPIEKDTENALDAGLDSKMSGKQNGYSNNSQETPVSLRQKRDNHGQVGNATVPNKGSISVVWDEKYQRSRPLKQRPNKALIHYATEDMHASPEIVAEILALTMPISAETGLTNTYHGYGWTYLLSETQDQYVKTVELILDRYSTDMAFIQLLCDSPNETGLLAGEVCTPKCLHAIMSRLHYFSRYQIQPGEVVHQSANSIVRLAVDHGHLFEGTVTAADQQKATAKIQVKVALKFMKYREQYDREVALRASFPFADKFVLPVLCSHDSDADPSYKAETVAKGLARYPYLITMVAAERDLLGATLHEHFSGRDFEKIKVYAKQILEALEHIHDLGIIHGDVKPLNIVRSNGRFKIIDLGASVRFGDFAGTSKTSTAYLPPEMVFKKMALFSSDMEAGENEEKANYFSQHEATNYTLSMKTGLAVYPNSNNRIGTAADDEVRIDEGSNFDPDAAAAIKALVKESPTVEILPADPSMDMWAFGLVLYLMATGENLFVSDINDNIDTNQQLKVLAPFPDKFKAQRLSKCKDHWTRNLIFQCLDRNPLRRPTATEALAHPYFCGVPEEIAAVYRMPGQVPRFDVCLVFSTAEHAKYRRDLRHRQFRAKVDAERTEKERVDAAEVARMQEDHAKSKNSFLQIDFKPTSLPWVEPEEPVYIDCDQEEEARYLEERLGALGLKVCHCEAGKGLLSSHTAILVLSRKCVNNELHPQQNFVLLTENSDFDPYFYELRVTLEMQSQSFLEGGVISLAVGDKEEGEVKLARLLAEKQTRDRANAISEERQRARDLALEKDNKRKVAADRSRARKREMKGVAAAPSSPSPAKSPPRNGGSLSPSRESKADGKDGEEEDYDDAEEQEKKHSKFFGDEEILRSMSLSPSYLPYYASFEGDIIGKYGGAHPSGKLCFKPVRAVEVAAIAHLRKYFLGKVPILGETECSPAKLMTRITCAKQVLVMGEQEKAWESACEQIFAFVKGSSPQDIAAEAAAAEQDEARMQAVAKFLKQQMELKNSEIELLAKQMEAAQRQMQDKVDELHALHKKYSIF